MTDPNSGPHDVAAEIERYLELNQKIMAEAAEPTDKQILAAAAEFGMDLGSDLDPGPISRIRGDPATRRAFLAALGFFEYEAVVRQLRGDPTWASEAHQVAEQLWGGKSYDQAVEFTHFEAIDDQEEREKLAIKLGTKVARRVQLDSQ